MTAKAPLSALPLGMNAADEAAYFARLKMRNGTFKLTQPSRFRDWERVLQPFIEARGAGIDEVLDVGVSTGVTTVELSDWLHNVGLFPRVTGTDLFVDAFVVNVRPNFRVLCDGDGWPLLYEAWGRRMRPWTRRLDYLTLAFAPLAIARKALQPLLRAEVRAGRAAPIQMTTRLVPSGRVIQFVQDDVMVHAPAFDDRFGLIRAANILNRGYFTEGRLRVAFENIRAYLRGPGALLLVTRTNGDLVNHGTLFEFGDLGRFKAVARVGGGSEVEDIVLAMNAHGVL